MQADDMDVDMDMTRTSTKAGHEDSLHTLVQCILHYSTQHMGVTCRANKLGGVRPPAVQHLCSWGFLR